MSCKPTYKGKRYNSIEELKSKNNNYNNEAGFFGGKTAYIVKGVANKTTAIHEIFTHPFLLQIEKTNPALYKDLLREAKANKEVVDWVNSRYDKNKDHEYIARAIDLYTQNELNKTKDRNLIDYIREFFQKLSDELRALFNIPKVYSSAISPNITLRQLTQFAMYGKTEMNLSPSLQEKEITDKYDNKWFELATLENNQKDGVQYNKQGEVLAPNGKPSKLYKDIEALEQVTSTEQAEQLYLQTRSKEFKEWFGDSKVVDENGEPLMVYHGSNYAFDTFQFRDTEDKIYKKGKYNKGFFFSKDKDIVNFYIEGSLENKIKNIFRKKEKNPKIYPSYLNITNPYIENRNKERGIGFDEVNNAINTNRDGYIALDVYDPYLTDVYVAFEPNQIKSVFNKGEFSKESDNIYYQKFKTYQEASKHISTSIYQQINNMNNETNSKEDSKIC